MIFLPCKMHCDSLPVFAYGYFGATFMHGSTLRAMRVYGAGTADLR